MSGLRSERWAGEGPTCAREEERGRWISPSQLQLLASGGIGENNLQKERKKEETDKPKP